jgi:hypothetical protein
MICVPEAIPAKGATIHGHQYQFYIHSFLNHLLLKPQSTPSPSVQDGEVVTVGVRIKGSKIVEMHHDKYNH